MILTIGSRLGPYEVLSLLGAGGMGEVYQAKDTRLGRLVAVKVISRELPREDESRERFVREARAISTLSHPNICALFDVGSQEGIDFLVMEHLEGETLAGRLERGPLPQDQLLNYGAQIADALDKAHRHGIIHRDLKPGNIMLTRSGAKLLDFGLAKLREAEPSKPSLLTNSATRTGGGPLTAEGTIIGTIQYMSPEQLEGKEADARTDIFALGALLYEMATGTKAFEGPTRASLIAAIMTSQPVSVSAIQQELPPGLDRIIQTCMAKDPDDRWQSAHDLAVALKWVPGQGAEPAAAKSGTGAGTRQLKLLRLSAAGLLVTALFLAAALLYQNARKPEQPGLFKLFVVSPPHARAEGPLAISPDGRNLVFVATNQQGQKMLWQRSLDSLEVKPIPGTEDGDHPFWSGDGRSLGFFTQGKLKKVPLDGSPPQVLAEVSNEKGGAWNLDGDILFAPTFTGGLYHISPAGGPAKLLTEPDSSRKESSHRWPHFLPDGRHFVYAILSAQREYSGIYLGSLRDTKLKRRLLEDFSRVEYVAPGYLVFLRGSTLMAQPFDARSLEPQGDALTLGEKAGYDQYPASGAFSISSGVLAFGSIEAIPRQLTWYDREGKKLAIVGEPADYNEPSISPDEKRLVLDRVDSAVGNNDLWIVELVRGTVSRFTFEASNDVSAIWSRDGSRVIFSANPAGPINIFQKPVTGPAGMELLVDTPHPKYPNDLSLDGRWLMFEQTETGTKFDLWFVDFSGDPKPQPFLQTPFNESHARFSPDANWVAYTSDESGRSEVYLRHFPRSTEGKWQISTNGGDQAQWRGDGKELFYLTPERMLMSVQINMRETLEAGIPSPLFELDVVPNTLVDYRNQYVVAADGKRFLVTANLSESAGAPITLILNWRSMLRR